MEVNKMASMYKFEGDKEQAEYLQFFEQLKSKGVPYKDLDKETTRGIGILDFKKIGRYDDFAHHETITYIMNPFQVELTSNIKSVFSENSECIDILMYCNTLEAKRQYLIKPTTIWGGFLNLKNLGEKDVRTERYVGFSEENLTQFNIKTFHSNQIVHPLHYRDLEQIMQYLKEGR
jgi:hypothetical protein